ncbi:putative membrane-associated kinase regulator [Helianthus annuus]|nr:putative membrane-associated kinase regulator [Helianthus annuus]
MDVFSLLKFWRNAGVGDPITTTGDFDDENSFFDLVFTHPNNLQDSPTPTVNVISGFHIHSHHYHQSSNLDGADLKSNHIYSPPLFFNNKRKILPLDSTTHTKTPRSPFRVFMLGFHNHKPKSDKKEMKCEIEEVTISSLLNSSHDQSPSKRFSKEVVNRYLNLVKPFYIKVSRRSNDKVRLSEHNSMYSSPKKEDKPSVFKEVRKHLGKSRSSSSSSAVKPFPSPAVRRDDSALQQQDGIQSAILHCKKSYNSPSPGGYVLSRSGSAPSQGPRISIEEEKRSSI